MIFSANETLADRLEDMSRRARKAEQALDAAHAILAGIQFHGALDYATPAERLSDCHKTEIGLALRQLQHVTDLLGSAVEAVTESENDPVSCDLADMVAEAKAGRRTLCDKLRAVA